MSPANLGFCRSCRQRVPVEHVFENEKVYLRVACPTCGDQRALLSNDVTAWQRKREQWHYEAPRTAVCNLQCAQCGTPHEPSIAFVDVTNRCNMMCPICIANIRGMGFDFHPPLEYFDKLFADLGKLDPVPLAELFGGEPTVRDDLLEIIHIARKHGVKSRVVTNGLRLADEEYCRALCEAGVRFRIAIDGRSPEIYERMRHNPQAFEKKMKALANLQKYSHRKNAILCCAARGINDGWIADLIACVHEHAEVIDSIGLLPLTEVWEEGTFEHQLPTTREDAEKMVEAAVEGGKVEFVPAGLMQSLRVARKFLKLGSSSDALMFAGVHPDCETMALLASDGQRYVSINHYLKIPLGQLIEQMTLRGREIHPRLMALDPSSKRDRKRGKRLLLRTYLPLALRAVHWRKVARGNPVLVLLKIAVGVLRGDDPGELARKHLNLSRLLRVAILPFEESNSIDTNRLRNCKAVFAYEDVDTSMTRMVPACTWAGIYRNDVLRKIAAKYASPQRLDGAEAPQSAEPATS